MTQHPSGHQPDQILTPSAPLRAIILLAGAVGAAFWSAWIQLLDHLPTGFVLHALDDSRVIATIPTWLVATATAALAAGVSALLYSALKDPRLRSTIAWALRWAAIHPLLAVCIAIAVAAGAVDWYELFYDPYNYVHGLRPWMIREDLQAWLGLGSAIMGAAAISAAWPLLNSLQRASKRPDSEPRGALSWFILAAIAPLTLGSIMAAAALDGVPHFSDALTYLIQGRMLFAGHLSVPTPPNPDLWVGSLFFVETEGRFFGKYPAGWPAILGAFDYAGIGFAANAALAALAATLTGLLAKQFAPTRVAVLAALLFGLSPWAWFNGANFASHVASTVMVTSFLWLFIRTLRTSSPVSAIGAGLVLGIGVLIRPFDAAMFALPAIPVVLYQQIRHPKQWLPLGTLIAAAALIGVGTYMTINAQTTGSPTMSPYALEERFASYWNLTPGSIAGRLAFQWAEINARVPGWGIGGITVAILGAIAAGPRWRTPGLRLTAIATIAFFLGNTVFVFTNVWWGPRWLLPVTPLLAILGAELIHAALNTLVQTDNEQTRPHGAVAAAQFALCLLIAGTTVGLLGRYPSMFAQHRLAPPHGVSAEAHNAVLARMHDASVDRAVVAMPPAGSRPPLDARAGMVFMNMPFEANQVIYVRGIADWARYASDLFPGRALYELKPDTDNAQNPKGFTIDPASL